LFCWGILKNEEKRKNPQQRTNRKIKIDSYPISAKKEGCEVGGEYRSRGKGQKGEGTAARQLQPSGQKGGGQHGKNSNFIF